MTFDDLLARVHRHQRACRRENLIPMRIELGRDLERDLLATADEVVTYRTQFDNGMPSTMDGARIMGIPVRLVDGASLAMVAVETF